MPSTDEMILALVEKHGFTLPEGLEPRENEIHLYDGAWTLNGNDIEDQQAHDLCACEFAWELTHGQRNARALGLLGDPLDLFREWLGKGDSAAAIRALFDAMEAKP